MKTPRLRNAGNSLTPALIIVAALAISGLVFFKFTRPQMQKQQQLANDSAANATQTANSTAAPIKPAMTNPSEPNTVVGNPPPGAPIPSTTTKPAIRMSFSQPVDLAKQFARAISTGDSAQAAKMAASSDPTQEKNVASVLDQITKDLGYKIGPEDKIQVLGQAGEATRVTIPLIKPGETVPSLTMQLDVIRDPQFGWRVSQFHLPKELASVVADSVAKTGGAASTPSSPAGTLMSKPGEVVVKTAPLFSVENNPDPLSVAHVFVQALLHQDFASARALVDGEKVPNQKLAGLCILFEEGSYELKPAKPLVMTIASESESWVIAQVQSAKLQQATEFGLEMQRDADKQWRIVGLNLSDLLGSFAKSTGKMGVPYTPLVKNPGGGESLALYFEYDQANLHPRAEKQLEIVAGLLKANASRKLRITGHTDAKGTDDYNLNLSSKRALSVKLKLAALGVSPDQVVTTGVGKAAPLGPNQKADGSDDPEGRSHNRRAEIYLDF